MTFFAPNKYFWRRVSLSCSIALLSLTVGCNRLKAPIKHNLSAYQAPQLPTATQLNRSDLTIKPRVVVLTDFGEDPDDEQSMVRLLLYGNEFDLEGLLVTADGSDFNSAVQDGLLKEYIDAYDKVEANLRNHAEGYPSASQLKELVKPDLWVKKRDAAVGENYTTPASEHIIEVVDRADSRPVWFVVWGGPRPLSQALWQVKNERTEAEYQKFLSKIRIYSIYKQDNTFGWLEENAASAFTILNTTGGKPNQTFRGMYLTGDTTTVSSDWIEENVIKNHGPLGEFYPAKGAGVPGIKEGDTPSFLYLLSQRMGLSNINFPSQGGWGGRFLVTENPWYSDEKGLEQLDGKWDRRHSVSRWRNDFNNDFAARMDWSASPNFDEANHPPQARISTDEGESEENLLQQIIITAQSNQTISLNAGNSTDPDGDALDYQWLYYPEAGNYDGELAIENASTARATITLPEDWQNGHQVHIILRVTDQGSPPLTRYRRVIINAAESSSGQNLDSNKTDNENQEKLTILPLGDSITQAENGHNSYRRFLYQKLTEAGYEFDFVGSMNQTKNCGKFPAQDFDFDHEGHWGWRIDEILEGRIGNRCKGKGKLADWLNNYTPNVALVHLGTNDVIQGNSTASSITELEQVIKILRQKNPEIAILVAQVIPVKNKENNQAIIDFNSQIPALVERTNSENSPVILVDQFTDYNPKRDNYDGVHPNKRGERIIAQKWFESLTNYLATNNQ